jgi:hypothetical protein
MSAQPNTQSHYVDDTGNPAGGTTSGPGISISWQNGPVAVDGERKEPNGAFVEGVIAAAVGRLEFYQDSKFRCRENALAITKLEEALHWLGHRTADREARTADREARGEARTADREARGIEGTHEVSAVDAYWRGDLLV